MKIFNLLTPILLILFLQSSVHAQWNPQTSSTTYPINREGSVGIGLSLAPYAQLHVRQLVEAVIPGQEVGFIPAFRLQRDFNGLTP